MPERGGIDRVVDVVDVELAGCFVLDSVRGDQDATGPEHASELGEYRVLGGGAGYVVEHVKRGGAAESIGGQVHGGGVAVDDVDVGPDHARRQRAGQLGIELQCR